MFHAEDTAALTDRLDRFAVPMFAADRYEDGPWRITAVNAAHARATQIDRAAISGTPLDAILPAQEARIVARRYTECVTRDDITHYFETLHINDRRSDWRTTLQPLQMGDGRQRVVGTALQFQRALPTDTADDTAYFGALAQMQLGKVQCFLEYLEGRPDLSMDLRERTMLVAGLSRSLAHILWEMRERAGGRGARLPAPRQDLSLTG